MRTWSAFIGVVAMLGALLTSPFFHFHDHDDHGPASLVHAHFWEPHVSHTHDDSEVEASDSHEQARAADFYTFSGPTQEFQLAIGPAEAWGVAPLEEAEAITIPAVPCAHGPPGTPHSVPRSPPTV
jgi:hypothetical protein